MAPSVGKATGEKVTSAPVVRTVVKTLSEPLDRISSGGGSSGRAVVEGSRGTLGDVLAAAPATAPPSSGRSPAAGFHSSDAPRFADPDGAVDRRAARRHDGAGASSSLRVGNPLAVSSPLTTPLPAGLSAAPDRRPEAAASSARADSSDDGEPGGNPLFGPPATGGTAAPAGLTMLAFAMLVAMLGVALRQLWHPLHMSLGHRGLAATPAPIERPG